MRKFLLTAVAFAILALGSVTRAKAQVPDAGLPEGAAGCQACVSAAPYIMAGIWTYVLGGAVINDIMAGGLNRKYAEVVPGNGYQSRDNSRMAELTHSFNVAMGYSDDADTTKYLASASR